MQPEDQFDLPDEALPSIEPVQEQPAQPQPQSESPRSPLLPEQPSPGSGPKAEPDQGRHHLSSVGRKYFNMIEFDDEEMLLAEIRKHPFGFLVILMTGFLIALVVFLSVAIVASAGFLNNIGYGDLNSVLVFAGFLLSNFVVVITLVNAHLYRNNVVFVTNEKLAQVLFITLFNRKISQLSIGDVQDVTVEQNGFLPNLVGYGTLVVETAGEQQNYTFTFVPKPYETSKIIINAHESNLKQYGN